MLKNYFKTAIRTLWRNKQYTLLNISGLAAGIAVCLVIFVIIQFELNFENFQTKKDRIYRVLTEYHHADAGDIFYGPGVPFPLPASLKTSFPQVEKITPIYSQGDDQILVLDNSGKAEKKFKEENGVFFTEPSFFEIFSFPFLIGDPNSLKDPNTTVITKEIAEKYFGDWKSAMGKTLKWNNRYSLKITGVLASIPPNTDFQLKLVIAYGTGFTANFAKATNWDNTRSGFGCYILLPPKLSAANFNEQLRAFAKKMKSADNKDSQIIQALGKVHFDTGTGNYSSRRISPQLIRALWLIAAFILLIACINFINLSTAQAVNRAMEVGVRKVLGGNKFQLRMQFLTETFMLVLVSTTLAVLIAIISLPSISQVLDLPLSLKFILEPDVLLFLGALLLVVTILAGFYPSLVLSGFNPIRALKSKLAIKSSRGISLRRGLVVFQFIIAQALIIGTFIMARQMNYFNSSSLGFDKDAILNIPFPGDSAGISKLDYLKKKLSEIKGIQEISFSSNTPVEDDNDSWSTFKFNHAAKETDFYAILKWTDDEYISTYKIKLVAGRNIERSDTVKEFLVNEMLIKNLGLKNPENALGREIDLGTMKGPIVGVMKDFNDRSFRRDLAPVLLTSLKREYSQAGLKLATSDFPGEISQIGKVWEEAFPDFVFEYQFLDTKIENFYNHENQLTQLYKIFAAIAIFLSCLGLYGLASFMAVQRIKEVGVRKVLGASIQNIIYLFSKEFIMLIGIAFAIAAPIAWYFMHLWLQNYPFRINMSWWIFVLGGVSSLVIAVITVSSHAIKSAMVNPARMLRSE
jgi:putative ABC transport system permease protein